MWLTIVIGQWHSFFFHCFLVVFIFFVHLNAVLVKIYFGDCYNSRSKDLIFYCSSTVIDWFSFNLRNDYYGFKVITKNERNANLVRILPSILSQNFLVSLIWHKNHWNSWNDTLTSIRAQVCVLNFCYSLQFNYTYLINYFIIWFDLISIWIERVCGNAVACNIWNQCNVDRICFGRFSGNETQMTYLSSVTTISFRTILIVNVDSLLSMPNAFGSVCVLFFNLHLSLATISL